MAYSNFKPTVWSKHIQRELEKATVLQEDCNTEFEGEAKKGERVKILGVARPTIGTYTGQDIGAPEDVPDTAVYLPIDQAKFFNFGVDDVDKAQSVEGLMPALMAESSQALAIERDRYIASLAVEAGGFSNSTSVTTADAAKTAVDKAFVWLWEHDVKIGDDVVITVTPWFYNLFKDKLTTVATDNMEILRKGLVGTYNGARVKISNLLYNDGTDDYLMIRTKKAIAFAGQINETEAYRPEGLFKDAVKGLDTYGAKVVRPKELYVVQAHNSEGGVTDGSSRNQGNQDRRMECGGNSWGRDIGRHGRRVHGVG